MFSFEHYSTGTLLVDTLNKMWSLKCAYYVTLILTKPDLEMIRWWFQQGVIFLSDNFQFFRTYSTGTGSLLAWRRRSLFPKCFTFYCFRKCLAQDSSCSLPWWCRNGNQIKNLWDQINDVVGEICSYCVTAVSQHGPTSLWSASCIVLNQCFDDFLSSRSKMRSWAPAQVHMSVWVDVCDLRQLWLFFYVVLHFRWTCGRQRTVLKGLAGLDEKDIWKVAGVDVLQSVINTPH